VRQIIFICDCSSIQAIPARRYNYVGTDNLIPDNMTPKFKCVDGELVADSQFGEMRMRLPQEPRAVVRGRGGGRSALILVSFCDASVKNLKRCLRDWI
jgi:hypothetical protein